MSSAGRRQSHGAMTAQIDFEAAAQRMLRLVDAVADDAPLMDRILGVTGRRPDWQPPRD